MRLLAFVLFAGFLGVTGCNIPKTKDVPAAESPRVDFPNTINDTETLVHYGAYLRRLSAAELNKEHEAVKQNVAKSKTDLNRAQLAMIYSLPGLSLRDDAKALTVLEPLSKDAQSPSMRNFASLLLSLVAENKRLDEGAQALNAKLKDEQRQTAELQQKLEALKSIEKSLSDRDRTKQPAANKQP